MAKIKQRLTGSAAAPCHCLCAFRCSIIWPGGKLTVFFTKPFLQRGQTRAPRCLETSHMFVDAAFLQQESLQRHLVLLLNKKIRNKNTSQEKFGISSSLPFNTRRSIAHDWLRPSSSGAWRQSAQSMIDLLIDLLIYVTQKGSAQ